tara:strand:- start:196 stop:453 length:258 start_codon:yes stop_codon:yes gene_type:complete
MCNALGLSRWFSNVRGVEQAYAHQSHCSFGVCFLLPTFDGNLGLSHKALPVLHATVPRALHSIRATLGEHERQSLLYSLRTMRAS